MERATVVDVSRVLVDKTGRILHELRDAIARNQYALYYVEQDIAASKNEVLHALTVAIVVLEHVTREEAGYGADEPADNRVEAD